MSRHRKHLQQRLAEAERELDAATKLSEVRAAATKKRLALEGLGPRLLQLLRRGVERGAPLAASSYRATYSSCFCQ